MGLAGQTRGIHENINIISVHNYSYSSILTEGRLLLYILVDNNSCLYTCSSTDIYIKCRQILIVHFYTHVYTYTI